MSNIILDVYFGSKLAEDLTNNAQISKIISINNIIYFGFFIFIILIIAILVFVIMPKILRTPEKYFKRYLVVRAELAKIDDLYSKKKMTFEDYSFAQFHYAKEYEQIVTYLFSYPEYKGKLKSYKLTAVKVRESEDETKLTDKEKRDLDTINYFIDYLYPQAVYYQKSEIQQALLDEGYSREIAEGVTTKLEQQGVVFNSLEKDDNRNAIELVDSILENSRKTKTNIKETSNKEPTPAKAPAPIAEVPKPQPQVASPIVKDIKAYKDEPTSINLKEISKSKKTAPSFGEQTTTYSKYSDYKLVNNKDKTFFGSVKDLFKPKTKQHTISEINDVFKAIEKNLKENDK